RVGTTKIFDAAMEVLKEQDAGAVAGDDLKKRFLLTQGNAWQLCLDLFDERVTKRKIVIRVALLVLLLQIGKRFGEITREIERKHGGGFASVTPHPCRDLLCPACSLFGFVTPFVKPLGFGGLANPVKVLAAWHRLDVGTLHDLVEGRKSLVAR